MLEYWICSCVPSLSRAEDDAGWGQPPCGGHILERGGANGMVDGMSLSYLLT